MNSASRSSFKITLQSITSALNIHTLLPLVLVLVMLPHLLTSPILVSLFILVILFWFSLHTLGLITLPGSAIRFMLIITSLAMILFSYGLHFSQQASVTLLCLMVCLKLLEIKHESDRRNIFVVIFLCYFILITHFLYSQGLLLSIFSVIIVFILTLLLQGFARLPQFSLALPQQLMIIFKMFLKALPIALVLFLFFPRIPGPLWSLPDDVNRASTGLSDEMYPGSVTDLADSDEIAFRVDFQSSPPAADKLYWRGPVLSETDGFLWTQRTVRPLQQPVDRIIQQKNNPVFYTVTLEPHQQKWLFTLEMPFHVQGDTIKGFKITEDLIVENKTPVNQLTQYRVSSYSDFYLSTAAADELQNALKLTGTANQRTRKMGRQWLQELQLNHTDTATAIDKYELVVKALDYFRDQPFFYTKKPEVMVDNPADQFLFDKRRGFCEHYASSFVILMRSAEIPARVVTGYQGIEKNHLGNYYLVRQSNAHAWAEVWLEQRGWVRVDPTSVIPPERIENDIFDTDLERLSYSSLSLLNLPELSKSQKTALYKFSKHVNQLIDNMKYNWNNWILGYDRNKQNILLTLMGLSANWQTLIVMLISGIGLTAVMLYLYYRYRRYQQIDRVFLFYQKFLHKLEKAGLQVSSFQGPGEVQDLAVIRFPRSRQQIEAIMRNYLLLRYGCLTAKSRLPAEGSLKAEGSPPAEGSLLKTFKTQVRQFSL